MGTRITITESEILSELRASIGAVEKRPEGFYSVRELADQLNCSQGVVRNRIVEWEGQGRLEKLTVIDRRSDGVKCRIPTYRLKPKKAA